jgi:RHS repeat-associated protein
MGSVYIYDGPCCICSQPVGQSPRFTGKERDAETGNDYFGARYYASSMGRFLTPDDGSDQDEGDPQSWNLSSYVRNNPLVNFDDDGHDCIYMTDDAIGGYGYIVTGNCPNGGGGTYVDGTVNANSFQYNASNNSYSFTFTPYDSSAATFGAGTLQGPDLNGGFEPGSLAAGVFGAGSAPIWHPATRTVDLLGGIVMTGLGLAMPGMFAADAAPLEAGITAASKAVDLANLSNKIERNMLARGWTKQDIQETVDQGVPHDAVNKATGGPATEYVNPSNGRFVVVDNATKQVIQVSGPGHLPNYLMR